MIPPVNLLHLRRSPYMGFTHAKWAAPQVTLPIYMVKKRGVRSYTIDLCTNLSQSVLKMNPTVSQMFPGVIPVIPGYQATSSSEAVAMALWQRGDPACSRPCREDEASLMVPEAGCWCCFPSSADHFVTCDIIRLEFMSDISARDSLAKPFNHWSCAGWWSCPLEGFEEAT